MMPMAAIALIACLACIGVGGCSRNQYTKVTRTDGTVAIGTLVTMRPDVVVLQTRQGRLEIRRSDVKSLDVPSISEIAELEGAPTDPESMARNDAAPKDPEARHGDRPSGPDGPGTGGPGTGGPGSSGSGNGGDGRQGPDRRDGRGGPGSGNSGRGPGSDSGSGSGIPPETGPGSGPGGPGSGAPGYSRGVTPPGQDQKDGTPSNPGDDGGTRTAHATIPQGTAFTVTFASPLGSDTSRVEEDVTATLTAAIVVNGTRVVPAGAVLRGRIVEVVPAKMAGGRGRVTIRFNTLTLDSRISQLDGPTTTLVAQVFTGEDKRKVGVGAAAGAVIGGIWKKTKKAVGIGAAAGAGGTAAAVGATNELRIARGARVRLQFTQAVPVPTT